MTSLKVAAAVLALAVVTLNTSCASSPQKVTPPAEPRQEASAKIEGFVRYWSLEILFDGFMMWGQYSGYRPSELLQQNAAGLAADPVVMGVLLKDWCVAPSAFVESMPLDTPILLLHLLFEFECQTGLDMEAIQHQMWWTWVVESKSRNMRFAILDSHIEALEWIESEGSR